jgi:hypothetical protein
MTIDKKYFADIMHLKGVCSEGGNERKEKNNGYMRIPGN